MSNPNISEILADIYSHIKVYLKNYAQYLGYDVAEKSVKIASYILANFIVAAIAGLFFNIVLIALVFCWGMINNAMPAALLFLAIFYFILAWFFIIFRNALIKRPIQRQMIRFIFAEPSELEDEKEKKD